MPNETQEQTGTATDGATTQGQTAAQGTQADKTSAAAWDTLDAYMQSLSEDQRGTVSKLLDSHTQGLKTALDSERTNRKDAEKKLRDAAGKVVDNADLQKQLTDMADAQLAANKRADFYEDAAKPELGLADAKAAWLIINAEADEYINHRGKIDFDLLKVNHPGLFKSPTTTPVTRHNAGNGAGQGGAGNFNMNDYIRAEAGINSRR